MNDGAHINLATNKNEHEGFCEAKDWKVRIFVAKRRRASRCGSAKHEAARRSIICSGADGSPHDGFLCFISEQYTFYVIYISVLIY